MFAIIETNGASHIAIHVPSEGAEKSLPALANMLEKNATFIQKGWNEAKLVTPKMSITLGDKFETEGDGNVIKIATNGAVVSDDFVIATPEVFVSNAAAMKKRDDEISRLRTELSFVKSERDTAKSQLEAIINTAAAE